jgi:hypothetical protein
MTRFYILIDEEEKAGKEFAKLLSSKSLNIKYIQPKPDIDFVGDMLNDECLAGIILDYKLSYGNSKIPYDAPALAGHIRELQPNMPIVTLSGVLLVNRKLMSSYERTKELFDWYLDKSEVSENSEPGRRQLKCLADGYRQLNVALNDRRRSHGKIFLSILKLEDDPEGLSIWLWAESKGDANLAARLMIYGILKWSGPLLPLRHAAVFLGIDPDISHAIVKGIRRALYLGPFGDLYDEPRYWTHLLVKCAPIKGFAPALCKASGKRANTICDVCNDPFDSFYTVGVKRANAESPVENGRVCGICLDSELEGFTVRMESRMLIKNVIAETKSALKKKEDARKR